MSNMNKSSILKMPIRWRLSTGGVTQFSNGQTFDFFDRWRAGTIFRFLNIFDRRGEGGVPIGRNNRLDSLLTSLPPKQCLDTFFGEICVSKLSHIFFFWNWRTKLYFTIGQKRCIAHISLFGPSMALQIMWIPFSLSSLLRLCSRRNHVFYTCRS